MSDSRAEPQTTGAAAPPDDGGDRGAFATPDEQLDVSAHEPRRHPALHTDPAQQRPPRTGVTQLLIALVLLVFAIPILWQYCMR